MISSNLFQQECSVVKSKDLQRIHGDFLTMQSTRIEVKIENRKQQGTSPKCKLVAACAALAQIQAAASSNIDFGCCQSMFVPFIECTTAISPWQQITL